jgi:hypothetical protein
MTQSGYEYRDGALWVRLSGGDGPAATHAELLRVLVALLAEMADAPGGLEPKYAVSLFELLLALTPTAEHLSKQENDN